MKIHFDTPGPTFYGDHILMNDRMKAALIELMKAECEMLALTFPFLSDQFAWGRVRVGDLARNEDRFVFEYGGKGDHPGGDDFVVTFKAACLNTDDNGPQVLPT